MNEDQSGDVWLFGYGSLIWKPDIPFVEQHDCFIDGYFRRFWQGSPDHRGVEEAPGRVVTLLTHEEVHKLTDEADLDKLEKRVWGSVFRITKETMDEMMPKLEHREKAGYEKVTVKAHLPKGKEVETVEALVFRACPANDHFLGPAPLPDMVHHIRTSVGNSGPNIEYFVRLVEALEEMQERLVDHHDDVVDHHLQTLKTHIKSEK